MILFSDLYQEHSQDQLLFLPGKLDYKRGGGDMMTL